MSKYFTILVAVVLLGTSNLVAQRITPAPEITVMGGWMVSGGTDACVGVQCGRINVQSGPIIGGTIAIPARPGSNIELTYMYNDAGYIFEPTVGVPDSEVALGIHYMQIGAQQYMPNGNVHPYGSFTVGAAVLGSQWEFAVTAGLGIKNYINEKIAIRLDARVVLPIFFGGWYVGTGGVGAGGTVGMWQGAFTGGIVYRLGQ